MTVTGPANSIIPSPRGAIDPREHLTQSRPISAPIRDAKAAATTVSTGTRTRMFVFMVMLALYTSALTSGTWHPPGKWVAPATRNSWEGELRTNAATLIPALLRESLLPVELSERRSS